MICTISIPLLILLAVKSCCLLGRLKALNDKSQLLEIALATKERMMWEKDQIIKQKETELSSNSESSKEIEELKTAMENVINEKQEQIAALEKEVDNLKASLTESNSKYEVAVKQAEAQAVTLNSKITSSSAEIEKQRSTIEYLNNERESMLEAAQGQTEEMTKLQSRIEILTNDLEATRSSLNNVQKELQEVCILLLAYSNIYRKFKRTKQVQPVLRANYKILQRSFLHMNESAKSLKRIYNKNVKR
jgi:chromosome segregation ATPase